MKNTWRNLTGLLGKFVTACLVIAICLMNVSCEVDDKRSPSSGDNETVDINSSLIRVTGDLHDGRVLEYGAKTSNGYYDIVMWPEDMMPENHGYTWYGNIVYTDYDTCQRVFLCNVPGCAHNTPECTSFVKYSTGWRLFTDYSEKHLYLLSIGTYEKDIMPEDLASITEMNMDGSGRRTICTLSSNECFDPGTVEIASDDFLYLSIEHIDPDVSNPIPQYNLERIWFADGKREIVCPLRNNNEIYEGLLSVWGNDEIVLNQSVYIKEKGLYRSRISQNGEAIAQYGPESTFSYYNDRFMVTGEENGTTAIVIATDYTTGETMTIEGVPANAPRPGMIIIYGRDGHKINWSYLDKDEIDRSYVLDFSEGTYREFTLRQRNTYEDMPIAVIADAGEDYLVIVGEINSTIKLTDLEGIEHTYSYPRRPEYALISKEDYWNCTANYRLIDDKV